MTDITTEQRFPFTFKVNDGRGRQVAVEGTPVAASSDDTVASITDLVADGKTWNGFVTSGIPGTATVTLSADADLGAGVQEVIGSAEVNVTLDPRTGARIVELTAGAPEDKPA